MNVVVYPPNNGEPIFFEDASFTIGLNVTMDRITPSAVERVVVADNKEVKVREFTAKTTEYMDNQMLCIHRGKPAPDKTVRTTVVFAHGQWGQVWDASDPACPYREPASRLHQGSAPQRTAIKRKK